MLTTSSLPVRRLVRLALAVGLLTAVLLTTAACQATLFNPPRLATATAQAQLPPSPSPTPLLLPVTPQTAVSPSAEPTATPEPGRLANPILTVWVNETSPEHRALMEEVSRAFTDQYQVDIELNLVSSMLMPDLVETAVLSDTLPDIIIHPLDYSIGWAESGVFNPTANQQALDQLNPDTFDPAAIEIVTLPSGVAALPVDGYQQLLLFRQDWATERGLPAPASYSAMFQLAEATFDLENALTTGFVIPTESNLVSTHHAFEHIATANGCRLIDASGEVRLLDPTCLDAINFYYDIVHNFSPPGVQTDTSMRNAYLAGRTGMILSTPTILTQIAGLTPDTPPVCPECSENSAFLAEQSGILTRIEGNQPGVSANFGQMTLLGITSAAEVETAVLFADYWFDNAYPEWLRIESERKVPMRWGTVDSPTQFIDAWGTQPLVPDGPTLVDLYGPEAVQQMATGIAQSSRWAIDSGQGRLIGTLYQELTLPIVLQEMLSGYFDTATTLFEAYNRITDQLPNYTFAPRPTDVTPVPEEG